MPLTRFERSMPWAGVVAGVCWVGQDALQRLYVHDAPGAARADVVSDHLVLNHASVACQVVMGVALLFFATAARNLLRSGEAREATYSSVAYAGWIVVVAGLSQMVMWNWGLINGAGDKKDDAALRTLSYVSYFGWAGMGIGLATAFIAMGLGGLRNTVLPRWFALLTVVCGVLGGLGNAGIPPGGLVTYVVLPFWLCAAAVIIARRTGREAATPELATPLPRQPLGPNRSTRIAPGVMPQSSSSDSAYAAKRAEPQT